MNYSELTVDVKQCHNCIYWNKNCGLCTYIIETGQKRQHEGKMCYSFLDKKPRRRRRAKKEPQRPAISAYDAYRVWLHHMA